LLPGAIRPPLSRLLREGVRHGQQQRRGRDQKQGTHG
jgi:hypothetical protein